MRAVTDHAPPSPPARHTLQRVTVEPEPLARAIVNHLFYTRGTLPEHATRND